MFCLTQVGEDTFLFDHPELKLCGVQDVEIQLLTSLFTSFSVSCFFLTSVFKLMYKVILKELSKCNWVHFTCSPQYK